MTLQFSTYKTEKASCGALFEYDFGIIIDVNCETSTHLHNCRITMQQNFEIDVHKQTRNWYEIPLRTRVIHALIAD